MQLKLNQYCVLAGLLASAALFSCKTTPEQPAAQLAPAAVAPADTSAADQQALAEAKARAEAKIAALDAAREAAVDAGIEDILPDRFKDADALAASARDKFDKGDYAGAERDASDAAGRYEVLKTIADAFNLKAAADEYDFYNYDPDNYDAGMAAGNSAVDRFDEGSLVEAQANAGEAVERYRLVLENGWAGFAEDKSGAAQDWRQAALDAKANVAVRDIFTEADSIYNQAFVALRSDDYQNAVDLFDQSRILFRKSRDAAVEKRVRAEEALRQAERKVSESGDNAKSAQAIIGEEE